ncbi:hypothetical protein M569_00901, partial [Genlisea aurea]
MAPSGTREITVLSEFKPFGLTVEAQDGVDPPGEAYEYFLFDDSLFSEKGYPNDGDGGDHEIFVRGSKIIWSAGRRVHKRFTLPSKVIKVCWCRMGNMSEASLCVLLADSITIYEITGEVVSIPLPHTITSIWPLPFGLLLLQEAEDMLFTNITLSPSNPSTSRDVLRSRKDAWRNLHNSSTPPHLFECGARVDGRLMSSHLMLKDPLEDPQVMYAEERGKHSVMREFDERTIWTSECVPLMVSHNKAKLQHSLWVAEALNSDLEETLPQSSTLFLPGMQKKYLFRRIWQGKGSQIPATKVFLAADLDATPVICFLLQDQKKLLSLRLQSLEVNEEIVYDVKPDMSWSISAISAAAVIVSRPKTKMGQLPLKDVIALTPDNTFLLYLGNLCLCKFVMPPNLSEGILYRPKHSAAKNIICNVSFVDLMDAVEGRANIVLKNGQTYRCIFRHGPSSSLTDDCLSALSEGLSSILYHQFLCILWGGNDAAYLSKANMTVDSEWKSFCHVFENLCHKPSFTDDSCVDGDPHSSWEFLIKSKYNLQYLNSNCIIGGFPGLSCKSLGIKSSPVIMPTKFHRDESFHRELLTESLDALHAVYETLKLDMLRKRDLGLLVVLLSDIANFLQEIKYLDHYKLDFPILLKDLIAPHAYTVQKTPPNLMRWLESCLQHGYGSANPADLPRLICIGRASVVKLGQNIVSFYGLLCGAEQFGGRLACGLNCNIAPGLYHNSEELTVLAMVGEKFGLQQLDLLPAGVSLPLRHAVDKCRESPPVNWPSAAYVLIGREDLGSRVASRSSDIDSALTNAVSLSAPYMLSLQSVTIPSSHLDTLELENTKLDGVHNFEESVTDGMEHIFNSSTQMQYGRDLRLNEVRCLLCSAKPVSLHTPANPSASDQELQQAQLWHLAQRTTALPFGRGAFTLGTTCTFLTEALSVPKLVLAGHLPAQKNAMVNLDPNIRNIQELKFWPEFHNAVASGLRLSPVQSKIPRTWILYNKPDEPNAVHAGLLLALGLNGHLCGLTIADIFQYYSLEHETTTVGLMIGLAASYRGTMRPSISKSLFLHLPARHPSPFPELEVPTLIQSATLVSVGLLYEGSAHPQTMQILLSEIGRRSGGDNVLEREGYAVSAGFSLGLVALGRGEDAIGFADALVESLFLYIGGNELHKDIPNSYSSFADEHNRNAGQIMDGNLVNVDVTAPAAIIALALMYLKTDSEPIVSRLSIPQTQFELQYVRPDFILIRVIAQNLIMWSRVCPSEEWVESQVPKFIKHGVDCLGNEMSDLHEIDAEAFVHAYVNIIAGACISLGLRFAGTRDGNAQDVLYKYAIYFLNEIKPICSTNGKVLPKGLSSHTDRGTLEACLHLIVLSLCVVMSGSGNLRTLKLLKFLRSRNSAGDGHLYFGSQMAVSLGVGFLFLGGGKRTFSTSNSSIAALLITLYPRLPTVPNDNRCHLQAFRHLYVLATEARWIQTIDNDTHLPVYVPLEIITKETQLYAETSFYEVTPCILPERAILKSVRVCGPRYWPVVVEFSPEDKPWWSSGDQHHPFSSGIIYVKRKVGACSYADDPIGSQSLLSRAMHKLNSLSKTGLCDRALDSSSIGEPKVEQLVSTFSSSPSLVAFAQLFCDSYQSSRQVVDILMFCRQVLFECVSKDRPAMLQVYLSLYAIVESMADFSTAPGDALSLWSLKMALAYKEGVSNGILRSWSGEMVQSAFLESLKKRVEEVVNGWWNSDDLYAYAVSGNWAATCNRRALLLSWYLKWYCVPSSVDTRRAFEKMGHSKISCSVPLLRLLFPGTHVAAINTLNSLYTS